MARGSQKPETSGSSAVPAGRPVTSVNSLPMTSTPILSGRKVATEAMPLRTLMDAVANARIAGLIVLDACRDNPFLTHVRLSAGRSRSVQRGLAPIEPSGNLLVAFATREGAVADDGDGRNSPFTAALLRRIEQPGVEVGLLFRQVRDDVLQATGRRQSPVTRGELGGTPVYLR